MGLWAPESRRQALWTWRCCVARVGAPAIESSKPAVHACPRGPDSSHRARATPSAAVHGLPAAVRMRRRLRRQGPRSRRLRARVRQSAQPRAQAQPPSPPQLPALPRIRASAATPQTSVRDPSGRARHSDQDRSNERSAHSMTNRVVQHIRSNAVAYVALFVALGGTSYAALKLPANSVGTSRSRTTRSPRSSSTRARRARSFGSGRSSTRPRRGNRSQLRDPERRYRLELVVRHRLDQLASAIASNCFVERRRVAAASCAL